eukprot:scaffold35520_cov112-Isochrysis_galbana.AAC.2
MARLSACRKAESSAAASSARKSACAIKGSLRSARPEKPAQQTASAWSMSECLGAGESPPSLRWSNTSNPTGGCGRSGCSAGHRSSGADGANTRER